MPSNQLLIVLEWPELSNLPNADLCRRYSPAPSSHPSLPSPHPTYYLALPTSTVLVLQTATLKQNSPILVGSPSSNDQGDGSKSRTPPEPKHKCIWEEIVIKRRNRGRNICLLNVSAQAPQAMSGEVPRHSMAPITPHVEAARAGGGNMFK